MHLRIRKVPNDPLCGLWSLGVYCFTHLGKKKKEGKKKKGKKKKEEEKNGEREVIFFSSFHPVLIVLLIYFNVRSELQENVLRFFPPDDKD